MKVVKCDNLHTGLHAVSIAKVQLFSAIPLLDAGELPGWVQNMMGHETLKMIFERYYSYIREYQRDEGSAFLENEYDPCVIEAEAEAWDKAE